MAEKKKANKSTGPRTAAGKAVSSMNAVTHGIRSSRLLLSHEDPHEYQALLHSLYLDLQPVGAMEQLLVERIASAIWRRQRIEGAEQALLTAAQMHPATDCELLTALELRREKLPDWMYTEDMLGLTNIKPLPEWMREEQSLPDTARGSYADKLCREWEVINDDDIVFESEEDARRLAPLHWRLLEDEAKNIDSQGDAALTLKLLYNEFEELVERFSCYMDDKYREYYWVAYCHRHRDKMEAAFRAIRVKRMLKEWDPEKSHRYTTMLDNQLFKLLREFREMRAWRLDNLGMVSEAEPSRDTDAQVVDEIRPAPGGKVATPRRRKQS